MPNPIQHTNRFGKTYFLSASTTKKGKTRYVFRTTPGENPVTAIPAGYEITESIGGVVSLAEKREPVIQQTELDLVRSMLASSRNGFFHEAGIVKDAIVIFRRIGMSPEMQRALGATGKTSTPQYEPILRCALADAESRHFMAVRMVYRGDGFWLPLGRPEKLERLAKKYLPHVGEESFYELM